ncbi:MAG: caspase family protein, partial [Pseudomonadota bacterium]
MALVVGNAAYTASPLNNPVRDAEAMARALGHAGFDVRLVRNATRVRLKTEIEAFGAEARAKAADVVFYFAGHAVQTAQENFLLPVDTDIRAATDVQFAAIELGLVLRTLRGRGEAVSVIILDACRAEAVPALAAQLKP